MPRIRAGAWLLLLLSSLGPLASAEDQESININEIFDSLMDSVKKALTEASTAVVAVPDLKKTFSLGFLEGGLVASDGVMGDLSSIARTGDIHLVRNADGKSAVFTGSLHLEKLEMNFTNFKAFLSKISVNDILHLNVKKNVAHLQVSVASGDYCVVTVEEVKCEHFGGLKAELSKIRWLKFGVDSIATWVVGLFGKNIQEIVETKLKETLDNEFKKYNLCAYLL